MGKISESIFDGKTTVIPMADVSHVEKKFIDKLYPYEEEKGRKVGDLRGITIVTNKTTWNADQDSHNNSIWLILDEAEDFLKYWCIYRHELENL